MEIVLIAVVIYFTTGFVVCAIIASISKRIGKPPAILLIMSGPIGLIVSLIFWPLMAIIMLVELKFEDEKERDPIEKAILKNGSRGTATTELKLVGKVKIGENIVIARSVSGPISIGEKIEIEGFEMNHYKVKKVEPVAESEA